MSILYERNNNNNHMSTLNFVIYYNIMYIGVAEVIVFVESTQTDQRGLQCDCIGTHSFTIIAAQWKKYTTFSWSKEGKSVFIII